MLVVGSLELFSFTLFQFFSMGNNFSFSVGESNFSSEENLERGIGPFISTFYVEGVFVYLRIRKDEVKVGK